ncbi:hypothetical protein FLJC2902T_08870 [Flavobacterium limnosediminis JC2902]|uniref:Uncharacterized protein n=1 Tax=Flavobacterium limnosediminis JC2902 TaxID=1341181 RepID=V6SS65_9FLAO|nr:hypothetical protein [Flavobacterium limnosediminis]ESU29481.1 hypothetical protein FLJC2902T_08870 [Flavobacterium limnosediminis JC2902]
MIDFVKILIKDLDPSELEGNTLLDFERKASVTTGEIKTVNRYGYAITPYKHAYYKGIEFVIYDTGTVFFKGSLHKYWNNGAHNYNNFDLKAVLLVLNDLNDKFNITPQQCILKCLEVGVNITPPEPTNEILNNCLLHKTKLFEYQKNSEEGKYKQVEHSQYIIKAYNKALHYKSKGFEIDSEIMRFEIKYTRMEKLNKKGIFTLFDLINYGLHNFKNELITEWENVLFYDNTTQIDTLSTKLKYRMLEYSNPNYWSGLLSNNQTENFKTHRKQFKEITKTYSNNIQKNITEVISQKVDFLNFNTTQIDTLNILSKKVELVSSTPSEKSVCKVTGLDISMQKENSLLLSHTGLKYYYLTDKKTFEQIKRRYLSGKWVFSDYKMQIKEIAHNIRNTDSNQRIKQNRLYPSGQTNLLTTLLTN